MSSEHDDARKAIRALLDAGANPHLSDEQARTLVYEAIENAELVFGDNAGQELIAIAVEKTMAIFERGLDSLSNYAGQTPHQFGPNRHRTVEIVCRSCGLTLSIPLILSGQQSMYGCLGNDA